MDSFLSKRLTKYDEWLQKGLISHSSRIIPVDQSFEAREAVLPTLRALDVVRGAESVFVQNCECRSHYQRCDHPLEVCLLFDQVGEKAAAAGKGRRITLAEAEGILEKANQHGLVHLSLYMPDHRVFALCSCCRCCCHDLQLIVDYRRRDLLARAEYIAVHDRDLCVDCGDCAGRCFFGARMIEDGVLAYQADRCVGCGLCVTVCPAGAVAMAPRSQPAAI